MRQKQERTKARLSNVVILAVVEHKVGALLRLKETGKGLGTGLCETDACRPKV